MKDADGIGIAFEFFPGDCGDQRLMALARRRRTHHSCDRAGRFDFDEDGFDESGDLKLRIEQIFENIITATGLETGRDTDAGEPSRRPQGIAPGDKIVPVGRLQGFFKNEMKIA